MYGSTWALEKTYSTAVEAAFHGGLDAEDLQVIREATHSRGMEAFTGSSRVVVMGAYGVLTPRGSFLFGGTNLENLTQRLRQAARNSSIKGIVLDMDSPGGSTVGLTEFHAELMKARKQKKIIAVANATMASGAYWIASAAHELVSIPSGRVGSIGVLTLHIDESKALKDAGIKVTLVSAGKHKTDGNPFEPLSVDARRAIRHNIDQVYNTFTRDVGLGRGVSSTRVRTGFGEGRTLDSRQALQAGMVERIGLLEDSVRMLHDRWSMPIAAFHELAQYRGRLAARI